ncbi:hypothetical protein RHSIM_RhsimUnG0001700 [Rhododendron simsii]|uniref:Uncharacterized protein n=1 Tax=Rhododendron simsii TaxID=118357 RepID=A0A834FZZ1_RHOSS|nr:hypothetical protein RHSIM_RhsimUnG0001700 [Rhododendron simsii]
MMIPAEKALQIVLRVAQRLPPVLVPLHEALGKDEDDEILEFKPHEIHEERLEDNVQISMHALAGCNSFRTMRIKGKLKGKIITILIDSGSTHNFLEPTIAKHSGFSIEATPNLSVAVANGTRLSSKAVCKNLSWEMQGIMFSAEVRLLSLGVCDMVLGIQWLSTLGPILWDFRNLSMQFHLQGKPVDLKGETQLNVEQVNSKQISKIVQSTKQGFLAYMCSMDAEEVNNQVHSDIKVILQEFCDVFAEPKTLPPQRNADHKIPLKGGK